MSRFALAMLVSCVSLLIVVPAAFAGTASISGKVTSDVAGAEFGFGVPDIEVTAYEAKAPNSSVATAETSPSGEYILSGLTKGEYDVGFKRDYVHPDDFAPQFSPEVERLSQAVAITLTEGQVKTGVNAKLRQGASISGTVTDADTHQPLAGILVDAIADVGFEEFAVTETDANGRYIAVGLPSGSTDVAFFSNTETATFGGPYISQIYNEKAIVEEGFAPGEFSLLGNGVTVTAPNTTGEINAALVRKTPFDIAVPVASGIPAVGQLLSCAIGSWTGVTPLSYSYKWLRDGVPVAGATAVTYAVSAADQGNNLVCEVIATNKDGSASAVSSGLAVPAAPVVVALPVLRLTLSAAKLSIASGAAGVPISCAGASCSGTIELTEQVSVKIRKGGKTTTRKQMLVLGKASYSLAAAHSATIVIHLSAAGRKALAKASHHRLAATVSVSVKGGKALQKLVTLSQAAAVKPKSK